MEIIQRRKIVISTLRENGKKGLVAYSAVTSCCVHPYVGEIRRYVANDHRPMGKTDPRKSERRARFMILRLYALTTFAFEKVILPTQTIISTLWGNGKKRWVAYSASASCCARPYMGARRRFVANDHRPTKKTDPRKSERRKRLQFYDCMHLRLSLLGK